MSSQRYYTPALASRSYLVYHQDRITQYSTTFQALILADNSKGILLFLHGTESVLAIFIQNYQLGVLVKYSKDVKPYLYLSKNVKLTKDTWHNINFSIRYGNSFRISVDSKRSKSAKIILDKKMPSVMHYNQEIWIGGTPDNPVLDGLGIDSDVFPFRDRRSRLTDHGWNGAIQTISLNGKFYDNLLRNAQSLGNTSPFLLAYLRGKYFLGPNFFENFFGPYTF